MPYFRSIMSALRRSIDTVVFHQRQELVLQMLWQSCQKRFEKMYPSQRRQMLIDIIVKLSLEEEVITQKEQLNRIQSYDISRPTIPLRGNPTV